jgi:hypothetical protein
MKAVAKTEVESIDDDPRHRSAACYQRVKKLVFDEACHPAWGCSLYRLEYLGHLGVKEVSKHLVKAGDKYQIIVMDEARLQNTDPEEWPSEMRELMYRRIERAKRKLKEAWVELGLRRKIIDGLVLDDLYPMTEAEKIECRKGLEQLANLFAKGTKGQHKKRV